MRAPSRLACALLLGATCVALGAATAAGRRVLYDRTVFPPTWHLVGRASGHQRMHFLVAVRQQRLEELEQTFWAVSDPSSPQWQEFMSMEAISEMVASNENDMHIVQDWLKESLSPDAKVVQSADAVDVRCSVQDVERLFQAEAHVFTHDNGHTVLRIMGAHSVPTKVADVVDFVEGLSDFPMHRTSGKKVPKPARHANASSIEALVSPQTLLEMYRVPAAPVSHVSQGPAEFQGDASYNKDDLKSFFHQTDLTDQTVSEIVGPFDGTMPDTEATLDVQYMTSVGEGQVDWYWTSDAWMYQWSHNFFNNAKVPDAVSISWGWAEDQQCTSGISQAECQTLGVDSETYVRRVNVEFQKIGLRGVSLFVASGDSGANGRSDGGCTDSVLHASFPASSPFVTAVGATMLKDPEFKLQHAPPACGSQGPSAKCASGGVEVAVSVQQAGFTSGGGFSTYTAMPAYQTEVVSSYLTEAASELPPASYFNRSHRAYPDVSAMGNNFLIYMASEGGWQTVGGTSASSPTFSGVAAYLNDLSYAKSGKPLGFLNPLLYKMHKEQPDAFTDVTIGDNKCTEDGCSSTCKGYEAAKGWDPVSGLGTPVGDKMIAYVRTLLDPARRAAIRGASLVV